VDHHRDAIARQSLVELHRIRPQLVRAAKRRQGVFRLLGRGAPVRDDQPRFRIDEPVQKPAAAP
jgi:hypothetical protein